MSIATDRPAQLLMSAKAGLDYDAARRRIETSALSLVTPAQPSIAQEAAVLVLAECGVRMFKGGVHIAVPATLVARTGAGAGRPLVRVLQGIGCSVQQPPAGSVTISLDPDQAGDIHVGMDGWTGRAGPVPYPPAPANVLGGMLAGALAVSVAFRRHVMGEVIAGRREEALSAWGSNESSAPELQYLPRDLWLVGLGNLGQATLLGLSLLPYHDRSEVRLVLQDGDIAASENLDVQILTRPAWVGRSKARNSARWADALGFQTVINERRFGPNTRPEDHDPKLVLVGVDNLDTRRWVAGAGFGTVIDAGLGATGPEAFDIRLHAFPGSRSPLEAWPEISNEEALVTPSLQALIDQGRLDVCGAKMIAGKSVGVPCTAVAAAALQIGQACRLIATRRCADVVDVGLASTAHADWQVMTADGAPPSFVRARA